MEHHRLAWSPIMLMAVASVCFAQGGSAAVVSRDTLIGTWRLVSVETLRPGGEISHEWMGRNPAGLIIYDPTGHMSVQIMRDPRPTFEAGRNRPETPEEFKAAYQGYYAYFGTYEVNEADGMILHRVRASLWPREVGIEYRRHVVLTGDRLVFDDSTVSGGGRAAAESVDLGAREVGVTSRWRAGSSNQAVGPTAETAAGHRQR